ncbi:uncharacterized protein CIMG_13709 [Coccidioides immitis RS]|uniref:Uncharacterized protein n=1 Tax=Coccidioides immitis (strain RS) TaxID=246410 RepID=A0A0D8JZ04_COCIM|nr:uncharacterized protein CIMG_13709 [Coccidioides immitis RS]KJF61493.1 hypothetical protein CIMG_13709 [Coccidioides immitis RS]
MTYNHVMTRCHLFLRGDKLSVYFKDKIDHIFEQGKDIIDMWVRGMGEWACSIYINATRCE